MLPETLSRTLTDFLASACDAVVLEEGAVAFDLTQTKYSISGEYNKCLLHLWSAEKNIVRRVVDVETKNDVLKLQVLKLGQTRPTKLEICRERDRRSPTAKRATRLAYQRFLQRILERRFAEYKITQLTTGINLERSFGPIYTRGVIRRGQASFVVFGVNEQETQSSIDAALTFAILWLDVCRQFARNSVEGLKLFVPAKTGTLTRERMAHLNRSAAKWELYELDERQDELTRIEIGDRGNLNTRLVRFADERSARNRFAEPIELVHSLMSEAEVSILSPGEIAFRCHGLEFARARMAHGEGFRQIPEIVFGLGAEEKILSPKTAEAFRQLVYSIGEVRHAEGPRDHPLFRMHPERWLESLVIRDVSCLDDRLTSLNFYSQVPAFSASDRAMIDVLTTTRDGRLAVVELKANEDIHLPLQGLDYWSRVSWHHTRGEFQQFGYFAGQELSPAAPLLYLVAPALHIHPATDTILRYISPEIEWTLIAIDERWRKQVRPVFRKRPQDLRSIPIPA